MPAPSDRERRRRSLWRFGWLLAVLVAVASLVLAALDQVTSLFLAPPWNWLARFGLVIVAFAAGAVAYLITRKLSALRRTEVLQSLPQDAPERFLGAYPPLEVLRAERRKVADSYAKQAIVLFGRVLTGPEYRVRLEEKITIESDRAWTDSTAEYFVPWAERKLLVDECKEGARPASLVIPLLWSRKGTLLDDLVVRDASGRQLAVLSARDAAALVGWACIPLFSAAATGDPGTSFDESRWRTANRIRQLIAYPDRTSRDELWTRVEAAIREGGLDPQRLEQLHAKAYDNFRKFCGLLADSYVLVVEVPVPDGPFLSIQYTRSATIPAVGRDGFQGFIEELAGLRPNEYEIPIGAASLFASYHAEIDGKGQQHYVRFQEVINRGVPGSRQVEDADLQVNPERPDHPPRMMLRNDSGVIYPHLHLTNLGYLESSPRLGWRVRFEEIPPGAFGPVIALSVAVTLITMVFAIAAARMSAFDLDAPALALAVPLFVITMFGFSFDRLARSSLPVVAGFVGAAVLAVLAVIILLTLRDLPNGGLQSFVLTEPSLLGQRFHMLLGICAVAGVLLVSYLVAVLTVRTRRYAGHRQRLRNSIGGENGR